jgi:hypothetical protein
MFSSSAKWFFVFIVALGIAGVSQAHHDRADEQGPDAILQHTEELPELVMEMTLPHRRSVGNQIMLNFFAPDSGETVVPTSVEARLHDANNTASNLILTGGDPTFGGALSTPQAGEWVLEVDAEVASETITFRVPIELY